MKLLFLFLVSYFTNGFCFPTLSGKQSFLRKLRHRRQASQGVCDREETYPCTQTVNSGTPIYGYCQFGPCIVGYVPRVISTFCRRRIRECCTGYTDVGGSCVLETQTPPCGSQANPTILSQESGEIASSNYPFNYDNNINCNWLITVPPGATLDLQVTSLRLENPWSQCFFCEPICSADRLVIQDSFQSVTHCGIKSNIPTFVSQDRAVTIQFITNSFYTFPGFRLSYTLENVVTTTETTTPATTIPATTTTEYIPPTTTTTEYIPPTTATTEYIPPTTTTTEYIPPTTTPAETVASTIIITKYTPETTVTTSELPNETSPPPTLSESPLEITYSETSTSSVIFTSPTDTSATTTRPYIRNLNRTCPGDQTFTETAPYCKVRCDNGRITMLDCNPAFAALPRRPGCVCPEDRPVMFGRVCISRSECAAFYIPSFTCPNGRIPTNCLPTCTLTCKNYISSRERCSQLPLSSQCVSGCMCPPSAPIMNREGACVATEVCSVPPKPKVTSCGLQHYQPAFRIIGGKRALRGSWPWAVQIIKNTGFDAGTKFQCGGAVICPNWVLTAAHCFQRDSSFGYDLNPIIYTIRIGKHKRNSVASSSQIIVQNPQQIIPHPRYNAVKTTNDIALIRLKQPLKITNTIRPACVPPFVNPNIPNSNPHDPPPRSSCFAVGWGSTNGRGPSNLELKQARLTIQPRTTCEGFYRNFISRTSFCVGGVGIEDTCQGDSGGPLLCRHDNRWYVDGITSYGKDCGVPGQPSVYTRVSAFGDWVRQHTGNDCGNPNIEFPLTT